MADLLLLEMPSQNSDPALLNLEDSKPFSISESEPMEGGVVTSLLEENSASSEIQDNYSDHEQTQTLPILQKIVGLSTKIQNLKEEHAMLSTQVKGIAMESFPGPDALNTLKLLSTEYELLKKKYSEEFSERKRLYNEVVELKGNIRVFCRCRPLNKVEITDGSGSVVEFDSSQDNELHIISSDSSKKQFKFDHVFKPEDSQETVFIETKPIVTSVLDGYNVCIFAYGQTGTGKTFTMEGTPQNRGVNYRTLEELFRISDERHGVMRYELLVSMLEVYNEKIRDLLVDNSNQPAKKLEIKQGTEGTQEVPGLIESRVHGTEEVWELLKSGNKARSVGSTSANELSSRSHCLLRVTVKGENLINGQRTRSHLWLVDLAGSERVGRIEVEGERLKESQFINKSLSALGDVISALASKTSHIPYRNSKLTHMLQSSLGGDCKTLMFVQISPSAADLGETVCSLNFASRVRGIESGPARKQTDVSELLKYKQMVEKLKHDDKETKKLQDTVQSLQLRLGAREHICRNLQEKVRELENHLAEERKTRIKQEARAFAAASSAQSSGVSSLKPGGPKKNTTEKKPPLCPSKPRQPLRRISNFVPQPASFPARKSFAPPVVHTSANDKENNPKATDTKCLVKPARRISIAVRPPPSSHNVLQPRRRVSMATLRPESNSYMTTPSRGNDNNASSSSSSQFGEGRHSIMMNPRKARYSRLFTPLPELSTAAVEMTPRSSISKFMESPPPTQQQQQQGGLWRPKHPTVIALQKKPLVWSPLKARGLMMMPQRRSLALPPCSQMQ